MVIGETMSARKCCGLLVSMGLTNVGRLAITWHVGSSKVYVAADDDKLKQWTIGDGLLILHQTFRGTKLCIKLSFFFAHYCYQ